MCDRRWGSERVIGDGIKRGMGILPLPIAPQTLISFIRQAAFLILQQARGNHIPYFFLHLLLPPVMTG